MRSSHRITIFSSIIGGALLALLFVLLVTPDPLSTEHRTQLLTIAGLGLGSALVVAVLLGVLAPVAALAAGDLSRQAPIEVTVRLGTAEGRAASLNWR